MWMLKQVVPPLGRATPFRFICGWERPHLTLLGAS